MLNCRRLSRFSPLILFLFLVGCESDGTTAGIPKSPATPVGPALLVKISCDSDHAHSMLMGLDHRVFIAAVDGKSTFTMAGMLSSPLPYIESAEVVPGRHYLDLRYAYTNLRASGKVWFDAESGHAYIVRKQTSGYDIKFWVEDVGTGKVVGGLPGGEPLTEASGKTEPAKPPGANP